MSRDYKVIVGCKQKTGCKQTWSYRNEIVSHRLSTRYREPVDVVDSLPSILLFARCRCTVGYLGGIANASRDYLWLARQCRTILFTILRSELANSSQLTETSHVAFTCDIRIETVQAAFSLTSSEGGDVTRPIRL